jgi:hypothetical protein
MATASLSMRVRPCVVMISRPWQIAVAQGLQRVLDIPAAALDHARPKRGLTEQAHQVVGHHHHAECSFRHPEVAQAETVRREIILQFLDAVLAICPPPVQPPDLLAG